MALPNRQYLNCKILHGGTLLQPWPNAFGMRKYSYFSEDYVIPCRNWMKTKKKSSPKIEEFFCRNSVKTRKKKASPTVEVFLPRKQFSPAISYYIRPEFVGFIHVGWIFFVWLSNAQISMVGHRGEFRGGGGGIGPSFRPLVFLKFSEVLPPPPPPFQNPAYATGGTPKSWWGDANSRWGDAPPLQFKYYL